MQRDPPPFVWAVPDEKNILNCEYPSMITHSVFTNFHLYRAFPSRTCSCQRSVVPWLTSVNSEGLRTASMREENITE